MTKGFEISNNEKNKSSDGYCSKFLSSKFVFSCFDDDDLEKINSPKNALFLLAAAVESKVDKEKSEAVIKKICRKFPGLGLCLFDTPYFYIINRYFKELSERAQQKAKTDIPADHLEEFEIDFYKDIIKHMELLYDDPYVSGRIIWMLLSSLPHDCMFYQKSIHHIFPFSVLMECISSNISIKEIYPKFSDIPVPMRGIFEIFTKEDYPDMDERTLKEYEAFLQKKKRRKKWYQLLF